MDTLDVFYKTQASNIDKIIRDLYENFKQMMNCPKLPDFIIQYVDSREDQTIYFRAFVTIFHDPIIMFYNIEGMENDENFESDLIHEFTHLYDYYMLSQMYEKQFIRHGFSIYSEYYAVQIETLYRCQMLKNINDELHLPSINFELQTHIIRNKNIIYMRMYNNFMVDKNEHNFQLLKKSYIYLKGAISILNLVIITPQISNRIPIHKELINEAISLLDSVKYFELPSKELYSRLGYINMQTYFENH